MQFAVEVQLNFKVVTRHLTMTSVFNLVTSRKWPIGRICLGYFNDMYD